MEKINLADWTLCFDFDGTLVRTTEVGVNRINFICEKLNLKKPSREILRRLWGLPYKDLINIASKELGWTKDGVYSFWREDAVYVNPKPKKFLSLISALRYASKTGVNLAIISSRDKSGIEAVSALSGIDLGLFSYVQGDGCHSVMKPDPAVFDPILKHLEDQNGDKEKLVYIGDTVSCDFKAAKLRGLKFAAISSSFISTPADFMTAGVKRELIFNNPAHFIMSFEDNIKYF